MFEHLGVTIIRRAFHTVSIPSPAKRSVKEQENQVNRQQQDEEEKQEQQRTYECRVKTRGERCGQLLRSKKALLCHMEMSPQSMSFDQIHGQDGRVPIPQKHVLITADSAAACSASERNEHV